MERIRSLSNTLPADPENMLLATMETRRRGCTVPQSAVEFEVSENELRLVHRPRYDTSWVREKFERGDELLVKGTFHLTPQDLVEDAAEQAASETGADEIL